MSMYTELKESIKLQSTSEDDFKKNKELITAFFESVDYMSRQRAWEALPDNMRLLLTDWLDEQIANN